MKYGIKKLEVMEVDEKDDWYMVFSEFCSGNETKGNFIKVFNTKAEAATALKEFVGTKEKSRAYSRYSKLYDYTFYSLVAVTENEYDYQEVKNNYDEIYCATTILLWKIQRINILKYV